MIVNGVEKDSWADSFKAYQTDILEKLTPWATRPDRPNKYHMHFDLLVKHITYILDDAYKIYPYISKLDAPLPLPCETFIQDIGKTLHSNETGILEVSYQVMHSAYPISSNLLNIAWSLQYSANF